MRNFLRNNRGLLLFMLCLGLFRTAIADWNPVPTGSMRPTILEGDVVLVNRLAYDLKIPLTDYSLAQLGEPERGDIVTFSSPKDGTRLIKRIVGLPGDRIELRNNVLSVNGKPADYADIQWVSEDVGGGRFVQASRWSETFDASSHRVQFLPYPGARADFGPLTVPADHYFMMGDNRDNSEDSRYIGCVPRKLLIGQAGHILVSADIKHDWQPRLDRSFSRLR
ncbi:MAG: signal peptidase I [Dokdonella sp.]|jgi:signal peptidase I|uniref:signal peptidase I n=1 Tax=Dokdonella sp. TaxID=2291710 RepID=UPI001B40EF0B|nr:signal peptidase I [Dokdonella sp.]MBK8122667.1 signal peptidase I [Dokdonella sp.]MBP6327723.1 signal peptidase I [Dokdonella sp.]MBP6328626.1 signal peptidase I [Dokdonella sp.]HNV09609.1 signal peptidase I [Dokdonella sp.]HQV49751.1 signal peptidase I [Dokdonella sp.]